MDLIFVKNQNLIWDLQNVEGDLKGKVRMSERGFETTLNLDLSDERLCRFVPGFHCHGKMCSISTW